MSEGRILVVDDESQIRRVMRTTLTSQGYEVSEATNGDEALKASPFLGVRPGASGRQHARKIRH